MFQKFQTLKHLKVNLDQEHFTKLKIYFKNHIITKNTEKQHKLWMIFNSSYLSFSFSPIHFREKLS